MLLVYMSDEGESTGMITSLAGTLVRFPELWVGENMSVQPAARQKTRMPDMQRVKKIPGQYVFESESGVLIGYPRDKADSKSQMINCSRRY
jgi:hypothetical protein